MVVISFEQAIILITPLIIAEGIIWLYYWLRNSYKTEMWVGIFFPSFAVWAICLLAAINLP